MITKFVLFFGIIFQLILLVSLFDQFHIQNIYAQSFPSDKSESNEQQFSTLIINTIPQTPNVRILIDDKIYKSDKNGIILFVGEPGKHKIELPHKLTEENKSQNSKNDIFYTFDRWRPVKPQNFTISLVNDTQINMDLGITRMSKINLHFLDANSNPINKSNIQKVILLSKTGKIFELYYPFETFLDNTYIKLRHPKNEGIENTGNLTIISPAELEVRDMNYTISEVLINNVNVIDKSKQQKPLNPSNTDSFVIYCKVYPLEIRFIDKIFGYSVNDKFKIRLSNIAPDLESSSADSSLYFTISNDTISIPQIPKGIYMIKTESDNGFAQTIAVALGKPQQVVIDIITYQSFAILGIIAIPILLLTILIIKRVNRFILKLERENKI